MLNETGFYTFNSIHKIAINPSHIVSITEKDDEAKLSFVDGESIVVKESFEEVMNLLGGNCEWRLP